MQRFEVAGDPSWYKPIGKATKSLFRLKEGPLFCVCCNKPILLDSEVGTLINNFKLFPNRVIHDACFQGQETVERLYQEYQAYEKLLLKYQGWQ